MFESDKAFQKLIYDIGFHEGNDTEFYLKKGFRVIAVEASPKLAGKGAEKFAAQISTGQLTLLNVGIGPMEGTATFYINKDNSEWSSFDEEIGSRGSGCDTVQVPLTTIDRILAGYGIPYYLKIDIEGYDRYCIEPLQRLEQKPRYVSVENGTGPLMDDLIAAGYDRFKYINQAKIRKYCLPDPPKEGLYVDHRFGAATSGPFGEETPGPWMTRGMVKFYIAHRYDKPNRDANIDGWYDLHACHVSVKLPETGPGVVADNDVEFFSNVSLLLTLSHKVVLKVDTLASRREWSQYFCQLLNLAAAEAEKNMRTNADVEACANIKWRAVEQLARCTEDLCPAGYAQLLWNHCHGIYSMASGMINSLSSDLGDMKLREQDKYHGNEELSAGSMYEVAVRVHHLAAKSLMFRVNTLGEPVEDLKSAIRYHLGVCAQTAAEQARRAESDDRMTEALHHHLTVSEVLLERAPYHEAQDGSLTDALNYHFRSAIRISSELAKTYKAKNLLRQEYDMHLTAAEGLLKLADQLKAPWSETSSAFSFHIRGAYSAAAEAALMFEQHGTVREAMEMHLAAAKAVSCRIDRMGDHDEAVLRARAYHYKTAMTLANKLARTLEDEGKYQEACGVDALLMDMLEAQKADGVEEHEMRVEHYNHGLSALLNAEKAIVSYLEPCDAECCMWGNEVAAK